MDRTYIAIDLKSFYASCEAIARGLDPLDVNLVVADESRTAKTICLAVSPALRAYGISSRARLFQVEAAVSRINEERRRAAKGRFEGKSCLASVLKSNPRLELSYIVAPPRMSHYIGMSRRICEKVYLRHLAACDMLAYSIDEVFIDATPYLRHYAKKPEDFARMLLSGILRETGLTATAGIGSNLFLAKVAMDVLAKKIPPDSNGCRVASLDVRKYRKSLWGHKPITDFWMIGKGVATRLENLGITNMGELALFSIDNENLLYSEFGVQAEYLIDHAWGWEPCGLSDIKAAEPESKSLTTSQVFPQGYAYADAGVVLEEMVEDLVLEMNGKGLVCKSVYLGLDYDRASMAGYEGESVTDWYGRTVPKPFGASRMLDRHEYSIKRLKDVFLDLFALADKALLVRRVSIGLGELESVEEARREESYSLFDIKDGAESRREDREMSLCKAVNSLKAKHGKNILLKASSYLDKARARERNGQIGGHKS